MSRGQAITIFLIVIMTITNTFGRVTLECSRTQRPIKYLLTRCQPVTFDFGFYFYYNRFVFINFKIVCLINKIAFIEMHANRLTQ